MSNKFLYIITALKFFSIHKNYYDSSKSCKETSNFNLENRLKNYSFNVSKKIVFISFLMLSLTNCNRTEKEFTNLSFDKNLVEKIKITEQLLKKIKPYKEYSYPDYQTKNDSIFLFNTFINFNRKDSILEGRVNPNKQNIYHIKTIKGLTDDEVIQLKKSIYFLSSNNLHYQEYTLYNPNKEGIYIYTYIFEDWMMGEPDKIVYLSVIDNDISNDEWFNSKFKILKKIGNIYLLSIK